jgi:hypothetical protein
LAFASYESYSVYSQSYSLTKIASELFTGVPDLPVTSNDIQTLTLVSTQYAVYTLCDGVPRLNDSGPSTEVTYTTVVTSSQPTPC